MTAAVANANASLLLDDMSAPISQAGSPASPTASFQTQQLQISLGSTNHHANGRSGSESSTQPGTPTGAQPSVSLEAPPGLPYAEFLRTWTDSHVARWLTDLKCPQHATTFRMNDIRGDVLLELDQMTLKEMGLVSVGDRIRIITGVKNLRQRCSSVPAPLTSIVNRPRVVDHGSPVMNGDLGYGGSSRGSQIHPHRRLDNARPAPLHLTPGVGSGDLPRLVRDGQDSARANVPSVIRPLPQPTQPGSSSSQSSTPTPNSAHTPARANLPPLPPPPRGQPPQPPNARPPRSLIPPALISGRRTPTLPEAAAPAFTNQPLPPAPNHLTPTSQGQGSNWPPYDPRSASSGGRTPGRSPSPLPPHPTPPNRSYSHSPNSAAHGRNASYSGSGPSQSPSKLPPRPATGNSHPYAQPNMQSALSPIHEAFPQPQRSNSSTPPPASANPHRGAPFLRPTTPSHTTPSLDDLRRKLIKFSLPDEGKSTTINAIDCAGGPEVLEKALRKFGKLVAKGEDTSMHVEIQNGGLVVEGWAAFLDWGQEDATGAPLSETQLLSIVHAPPDEPAREHGLTLRHIGRKSPSPSSSGSRPSESDDGIFADTPLSSQPMTKAMKRASSVSILSGLGVPIGDVAPSMLSPNQSPTKSPQKQRGPSKLRNFFGQRPPSELITTHLAEYFPNTEKKVLERTRRQSMMRASGINQLPKRDSKRDSIISWNAPSQSRFSVSTQGSGLGSSPRSSILSSTPLLPQPERSSSPAPSSLTVDEDAVPRVSISAEDGHPIEPVLDEAAAPEPASTSKKAKRQSMRQSMLQYLPPVAFPSETLSESLNLGEASASTRPLSLALSTGSKRMSFITELRSKRDKSDTASLMTVDEITAEVESRRASMDSRNDDVSTDGTDDWTEVGTEEDEKKSIAELTEEDEEEVEDEEEEEDDEDESDVTVTDEEDDGQGKPITSHGTDRTIKWIKGALIGAGSFGKVYLGMDAASGLLMAVKQVELPTGSAPNEERKKSMLSALEREIELLRDLHHPNIVQYLSSCVDEDHLNIFLEYVPGGSVTSLLRNYGAFEEPLVRNWVRQILTGLNYLHERDIIHRDIKGANMLVDNKGGIKISDFGISKKVEDNLLPGNRAHRPSLQGSVFWMAPEVVKQTAYTKKADIWSIGCLVVEMLTGEHPWAQLTQMQAIFKIGSSAKPTIPPDISSEAEDFLKLTFELNHEARPSAAELLKHPWMNMS